jgi:hypothetical protein
VCVCVFSRTGRHLETLRKILKLVIAGLVERQEI